MASSYHIGVIDNGRNQYRMWPYQNNSPSRGVNRSRKIITFSHLNSTNVNNNFMPENIKATLAVS